MHRCNPSTGGQGQEDSRAHWLLSLAVNFWSNERAFVKEIWPGTIDKGAPHPALTGMRYLCTHEHVLGMCVHIHTENEWIPEDVCLKVKSPKHCHLFFCFSTTHLLFILEVDFWGEFFYRFYLNTIDIFSILNRYNKKLPPNPGVENRNKYKIPDIVQRGRSLKTACLDGCGLGSFVMLNVKASSGFHQPPEAWVGLECHLQDAHSPNWQVRADCLQEALFQFKASVSLIACVCVPRYIQPMQSARY